MLKKIILLFLSAVATFFIFSYIDEYENLIVPYFSDDGDGYESLQVDTGREEGVMTFLTGFNDALSETYLSGDPGRSMDLPASDVVKRGYIEEIGFLRKRGQIMDVKLEEMEVLGIEILSPLMMRVMVREKTKIRYLDSWGKEPVSAHEEKEYGVIYTLMAASSGLIVGSFELRPLQELQVKEAK